MWKYKLYNLLLNVNRKQSCLLNHEFLHIQTFWMSRRWHLSIERRPLQTASENKPISVESERDAEITLLRKFMGETWIEGISSREQEFGLFTKNKDSFTHLPLSITKLRDLDALNDIPAKSTLLHIYREELVIHGWTRKATTNLSIGSYVFCYLAFTRFESLG